jgi:hypothetical protein
MKKILKQLATFGILITLAIFASYTYAGVWNPSPGTAPQNNTETPINTSSVDQNKTGGILSINNFIVAKNAEFAKSVTVDGIFTGTTITGSTTTNFNIGGQTLNNAGTLITRLVDFVVADGNITVQRSITGGNLANLPTTDNNVCATDLGKLVPCYEAPITFMCTASDGTTNGPYTTIPQYYHKNASGSCVEDDVCPNITGAQHSLPSGAILSGTNCTCASGSTQQTDGSCLNTTTYIRISEENPTSDPIQCDILNSQGDTVGYSTENINRSDTVFRYYSDQSGTTPVNTTGKNLILHYFEANNSAVTCQGTTANCTPTSAQITMTAKNTFDTFTNTHQSGGCSDPFNGGSTYTYNWDPRIVDGSSFSVKYKVIP